ncbi:MAG: hypothetical protein RIB41_10195 [Oceanibaculum nanhaiense]|uniref:hypothetical protein n=1 Tax=Oceanibaculum nanhaiense TaxID=1909734 RepID=UPI0032EB758A
MRGFPLRARLAGPVALLVPLLGAGLAALSVAAVWHFALALRVVAPFSDMFREYRRYADRDLLPYLIFPDNEHRPVLPRLVFIADHHLADSLGLITLPVSLLCLLAVPAVIFLAVRRGLGWKAALLAASALAAALFWLGHHPNLIWPKQLHMHMALLLAVLAAWAGARERWALAALAGLAASFSFGYGLVVFPMLVIGVLLTRAGGGQRMPPPGIALAIVLGIGALTVLLYLATFQAGGGAGIQRGIGGPVGIGGILASLLDPLAVARYFLTLKAVPLDFLLGSLGLKLPSLVPMVLAAAGIILFAAGTLAALLSRRPVPPEQRMALLLGWFCIGTALMTALARAGLDEPGQAASARYQQVSLLWWFALALWAALRWPVLRAGLAALALAAILVFPLSSRALMPGVAAEYLQLRLPVAAILSGVPEERTLALLRSNPRARAEGLAVVARRGWALHALPQAGWPGRRLEDIGLSRADGECVSASLDAAPAEGLADGWVLRGAIAGGGWLYWIVLADGDGVVRGLGVPLGLQGPDGIAWQGFVPGAVLPDGLTVHAVERGLIRDRLLPPCR